MSIFTKIGGKEHKFTGKEKVKGFGCCDLKFERYLIPDCIFVEIRYCPINWSRFSTVWVEQEIYGLNDTYSFLYERSIWIPKYFLDEADLSKHELVRVAA